MSDGQPVDLLVRGGTVVPCDGSRRAFLGDVAVRDGRIAAIVASGGPEPPPTHAARVIDASHCAVIPGFVNAHTHELLERGVFEDMDFFTWLEDFALPKDMAYEPRHQRAGSLLCQAEMIANGTTSFIDIFRFPAESAAVACRLRSAGHHQPSGGRHPGRSGRDPRVERGLHRCLARPPPPRAGLVRAPLALHRGSGHLHRHAGTGRRARRRHPHPSGRDRRRGRPGGRAVRRAHPGGLAAPPDRSRTRCGGRPLHRADRRGPRSGG